MRALAVTIDGELRTLEVKEPPPTKLVLPIYPDAPIWFWESTLQKSEFTLLDPTDEKRTVAVYEEDGCPADIRDFLV